MNSQKKPESTSRKPRVAMVYPFVHNRGGVERYLLALGRFLRQYYDIELAASEWDERYESEFRFLKIPATRVFRSLVPLIFSLLGSIIVRRERFALVHAQGASAFRQDVVTAHSCHKAWFVQSTRSLRMFSTPWLLKVFNPTHYVTIFIETIQYKRRNFRKIIAISSQVKKELLQYYPISEDVIEVIHHGVDYEALSPRKNARLRAPTRKEFGIKEKEIAVLFVGNEFRRKGLGPLMQAVALLANPVLKLLVVGRDDPHPFLNMSTGLGVRDQVIFAGPTDEVERFFSASDLFVLPTTYEPFGMVITEAMAAGLPVVVSEQAGAAELIENGVDGILIHDVNDAREIARSLSSLLNEKRRAALAKAGRRKMGHYTWKHAAEKTKRVYEQLLQSS